MLSTVELFFVLASLVLASGLVVPIVRARRLRSVLMASKVRPCSDEHVRHLIALGLARRDAHGQVVATVAGELELHAWLTHPLPPYYSCSCAMGEGETDRTFDGPKVRAGRSAAFHYSRAELHREVGRRLKNATEQNTYHAAIAADAARRFEVMRARFWDARADMLAACEPSPGKRGTTNVGAASARAVSIETVDAEDGS